jgi:hypothetical protein
MQFETMGLLVGRKTYSIAVACLNPEVLNEAPEDLFGQFLVVNEPTSRWGDDRPSLLVHDMQNRLYNPNDFALEYKLVGKHEPNQFFRVKRVRSHEREALLDARDEPDRPRDAYLRGRVVRKISREGFAR